jgi:Silencing defective 2 N-terminal ubiquitin domain
MATEVIAAQSSLSSLHFSDFKPMTEVVDTSVQVMVHFNSVHSLSFVMEPCGFEIKQQLSVLEGIPADFILLTINGHIVSDSAFVRPVGSEFIVMRATIAGGIAGGKGGFGAMLRSLAKQAGTKKTTDFGACRDLSGRRLRHVNDEKILQKWKEAKDKGEDFDVEEATPSGIELWYLGTPSWADGIKTDYRKKFMKPRRKTKMCMDWIRARKDRKAPEGAPASWGCPRGRRCEFAHGDEELRGEMGEAKEQEKYQVKDAEANKKRDAYMAALSQQEEATVLSDMVLQGIRAQKKARLIKAGNNEIDSARDTMQMLPLDGMDFPAYDDFSTEQCVVIQKPAKKLSPKKVEEAKPSSMKPIETVAAPFKAPKAAHPVWLKTLSGKLIVTNEGELESESEFATVSVCCEIGEGKWYYEVELLSAGLMQVSEANRRNKNIFTNFIHAFDHLFDQSPMFLQYPI